MSIIANEIIYRKSVTNDDTSANGGRMGLTPVVSGVKNNVWPDVQAAERLAGSTKYRKNHVHIANDADLKLIAPKVFVENYTPGDDAVLIFGGTHVDTQATKTETRLYGCGKLNGDVIAGATSLSVLVEDATFNCIRNGDTIRISNKTSIADAVNNAEYVVVNSVPSYVGNVVTFNIATGLINAYLAAATRVASVYLPGDAYGQVSGLVKTLGGTYNDTNYPILVDSIGGVYQTWTLTFSSATAFTVVGDTLGSVGSGTVGSNFNPLNADYAKPYFVVPAAAWGGTQVAGNTLVWTTSPATIPYWEKRVIPAGAGSLSGNKVVVVVEGESE